MATRVAINGRGRVGRAALRSAYEGERETGLAAVDVADAATLAVISGAGIPMSRSSNRMEATHE